MDFAAERKPGRFRCVAALAAALLAVSCSGRPEQNPTGAGRSAVAASEKSGPYDVLLDAYAPYMDADDPLAFPMKVRAVAADKTGLWRGGKDLFFRWCGAHARDWLDDRDATVTQQGDQHLGNIGTYLTQGEFGTLAFGMVDFDDSHRLPFQYELLQGVISLRLVAEGAKLKLDDADVEALIASVMRRYADAASAEATATQLLASDPDVQKLLHAATKRDYRQELMEYTQSGRFVPVRATKKEVKDVMRPARDRAAELAAGIAEAAARSPASARLFRYHTAGEFQAAVKDAVLRTRVGSAGSQGLKKYFVLLERPLAGVDHDVIVYVKQQIPTAPERAGLIPPDGRDPARRCAEDAAELADPDPLFNGWCRVGDESYWVSLREPWTDELDGADVKSRADLDAAARTWATAAGASHRASGKAEIIKERCTPELAAALRSLSDAYLVNLEQEYRSLTSDPRVAPLVAKANREIEEQHESAPAPPKKPRQRRKVGRV